VSKLSGIILKVMVIISAKQAKSYEAPSKCSASFDNLCRNSRLWQFYKDHRCVRIKIENRISLSSNITTQHKVTCKSDAQEQVFFTAKDSPPHFEAILLNYYIITTSMIKEQNTMS
jgi:hypothetical protein